MFYRRKADKFGMAWGWVNDNIIDFPFNYLYSQICGFILTIIICLLQWIALILLIQWFFLPSAKWTHHGAGQRNSLLHLLLKSGPCASVIWFTEPQGLAGSPRTKHPSRGGIKRVYFTEQAFIHSSTPTEHSLHQSTPPSLLSAPGFNQVLVTQTARESLKTVSLSDLHSYLTAHSLEYY